MNRFSEQARSLIAFASVVLGAFNALAGPGASYEVHLAIQSRNANQIQGRGVPMINDIVGGSMGLNPIDGPHLIAGDPTFYTQHQAKFTADLIATIPDPNFTGVVMMDYEYWWPCWEWSPNVQPAWTNYIKTSRTDLLAGHPQAEWDGIIAAEYKKETRKYFETTVGYVRALRPKAKVTFYGLPLRSYWIFNGVPQYGVDLNKYRQIHEQDLGWYFDLVDVICPSIYPVYKVGLPTTSLIHDPAENEAYLLGMVSEAVRNSRGKPVYPFFHLKYHPSSGFSGEFINSVNIRQGLEIPRQAGAAGVVIWDFFYTDDEINAWQNYFDTTARDHINNVIYPGLPTNVTGVTTFSTAVAPAPAVVPDETAVPPDNFKVIK
ncbi:MAG: hypothetical protein ACREJD_17350 [Phycisphaerales bacterium]